MVEQGDEARARLERVLDPGFMTGLEELSLEELRERRDQALAEREYQSYLRRLVQVRFDVMAAERDRRRSGAPSVPMLDRLKEVLSERRHGVSRGEAPRLGLPQEDIDEAERRAEGLFGDSGTADPALLGDEELDRKLELLDQHERAVSADRQAVLRVHDRLQDELKRRFREDPSLALR
jgi:hypothetical protein